MDNQDNNDGVTRKFLRLWFDKATRKLKHIQTFSPDDVEILVDISNTNIILMQCQAYFFRRHEADQLVPDLMLDENEDDYDINSLYSDFFQEVENLLDYYECITIYPYEW